MIARKLRRKWSPQQIAGWLKRKHPNEEQHRVSYQTIYRSLYVQTRGVLQKELQECLRSPRAIRRSRHAAQKGLKLRKIKDAISMSERPPEIEGRAVPGRWEGGLIVGSDNGYIATLVERQSPWQRGSNENTNRLLRQYVLKAIDTSGFSQAKLSAVARQLNKRPKRPCNTIPQQRN